MDLNKHVVETEWFPMSRLLTAYLTQKVGHYLRDKHPSPVWCGKHHPPRIPWGRIGKRSSQVHRYRKCWGSYRGINLPMELLSSLDALSAYQRLGRTLKIAYRLAIISVLLLRAIPVFLSSARHISAPRAVSAGVSRRHSHGHCEQLNKT